MENKYAGSGILLVVSLIVLGIGYAVFTNFTNTNVGPTSSSVMNTTASIGTSTFTILPVVGAIGCIILIIGLSMYYVSSNSRYTKASKLVIFFNTTTYYFGWGLLCFVIVAVPAYLIYLAIQYTLSTASTGSILELLKWIGIIIGAYFGLALFGYVMKKKLIDNWRKRRQEKDYEDNIKELPKVV